MSLDLSPVVTATAQWLLRAYPPAGGPLGTALAEAQARQAATVAAWLRYPTSVDAALVAMVGPGGSGRLDWLVGADAGRYDPEERYDHRDHAWRTWVDEVVTSWAACLLTDPALAAAAVAVVAHGEHAAGAPADFRRLTAPGDRDRTAAALLRHPDLLAPIADLHRPQLRRLLDAEPLDRAG
ncbi:hypothetical protein ACIQGZ_21320 [Streptomyces sp. NPDC092296]|uniref:hypothetical protein n=1 Tax=Streptomyces sp. NPDC092296 TaxID=3366012 RepID=UPI00382EE969